MSDACVDHINPCGTLKSFEDVRGFVERLFCEAEGLRLLCEECHQKQTNQAQREAASLKGDINVKE